MKTHRNSYLLTLLAYVLLVASIAVPLPTLADEKRYDFSKISLATLTDKIRGGWAGQMIGVSYGFPTEFAYRESIIPKDKLPTWRPDMISEALQQDDLYVDITFAQVLDNVGLDASTQEFGAMFSQTQYPLWHANLAARRALRRGISAELSGTLEHNLHAYDIDFQIEADFIGLMSPGLPQASNNLSLRAGRMINSGDGIYGGMYIGAMYGEAFFTNNIEQVVRAGLAVLPPDSDYAKLISDVLSWWQESPDDWQEVWKKIHLKWNRGEMCPEGSLTPFNIDAKINGAFVTLGLLYGNSDIQKTMEIATRSGQDSDCNPATALGILGVIKGYRNIPELYTRDLASIANKPFLYTDYSFNTIVESTVKRSLALVVQQGGKVSDGVVYIQRQKPIPAEALPIQDTGQVKEQISFDDKRWRWHGNWQTINMKIWRYEHVSNISAKKNAQAEINFTGTGVVVTGILLPDGGLADIYLDDKLEKTIDVYPDETIAKPNESLWHKFGMEDKKHNLKIIVRGEPYIESTGTKISISSLIVYQ